MSNLIEAEVFEEGIYQLETTDPVQGGANGIDNLQAKQLANRTKWLKENKQDKDAALSALAALVFAADKMIYSTGSDTFQLATLTAFARTLLDDSDATMMRATLGAAAAANAALTGTPTAPTPVAGTNTTQIATAQFVMTAIANLVASSPAALDTLNELASALGDDPNFATTMTNALAGKQPLNTKLTALAALAIAADKLMYATGTGTFATTTLSAFARTLLDDVDAAAMRATIGALGNSSPQIAKAFALFNIVELSGTYSQSGTVITVIMTAHGMSTGMIANLDFTSGTATDGRDFVVTVTDANTFTVLGKTLVTTSGNVTRNNYIKKAENVSSITDNGVGLPKLHFISNMPDVFYSVALSDSDTEVPNSSWFLHKTEVRARNIDSIELNCFAYAGSLNDTVFRDFSNVSVIIF